MGFGFGVQGLELQGGRAGGGGGGGAAPLLLTTSSMHDLSRVSTSCEAARLPCASLGELWGAFALPIRVLCA